MTNAERRRSTYLDGLDHAGANAALDPSGLGHRLARLPGQCEDAWNKLRTGFQTAFRAPVDKVIICGIGGSAIAGELVRDLCTADGPAAAPITVVRNFQLPFVPDRHSLLILCSHSGDTKETLALFQEALQSEAQTLVIAGGGALADGARERGLPLFTIDVPGEPRHAVGFSLMLLLGIFDRLGLLHIADIHVSAAVAALRQQARLLGPHVVTERNPAKQLAHQLTGRLVIVYGGGLFSGMARRWKTQLNENAKAWAFFEVIPEMLHNSVEAFASPLPRDPGAVALLLRPNNMARRLDQRYEALTGLLQEYGIPHRELRPAGDSPLAQILTMLHLGDYVSYYLGLLHGANASATPNIDRIKARLVEPPSPGPP